MKRIVLTITILLASTATTMADPYNRARPWTMGGREDYCRNRGWSYSHGSYGSYGSYGYGYSHYGYGSDRSLSDAIFGWTDERKLQMAEKEQDFRHEQEKTKTEQVEREQMFARARALKEKQAGQEQKNSENEKLRQEVEKMKLENEKLQQKIERDKLLRTIAEIEAAEPNDPNK